MRIVQITPGTGSFHCGSCLRDIALVKALRKLGHEVLLVPMYLPLITEEPIAEREVFFGGVNVFMQQQSAVFRHTPRWLDRWLDRPGLLRSVASKAHLTSPQAQGELMLSMLAGEDGKQVKELHRLVEFLRGQPKADVVVLSNAMLLGLAPGLQKGLGVKVLATLQGEDTFVDRLPEALREQAWGKLRELAQQVDGRVAVSRYYRDTMAERLHLAPTAIDVVYNGIDVSVYETAGPATPSADQPVVGYLARMCPDKGLHTLVDAFVVLMQRGKVPGARLHIAGARTPGDVAYVDEQQAKLTQAALQERVTFSPNVELAQKLAMLRSCSVLSVPATYGEAFGLYVLEALAMGVPVVEPRHGGLTELVELTGGGMLCKPDDAVDLAQKLEELLLDSDHARKLGATGQTVVREQFTMETMAREVIKIYQRVVDGR